jgi:Trk K+ transport system NAD-binding subunit
MKSLGLILGYLSGPANRRNLKVVGWLVAALVALTAIYSVIFHQLMADEGREFSWPTGIYWSLTVMSTLGFGDITFQSDAGRMFTVVVLITGALFIFVLLPFSFIQFIFVPWMERREAARAPRELPAKTSGHLVLTNLGTIEDSLIRRADRSDLPYVVIVPDLADALARYDEGYRVMVGDLDDPDTYRRARVSTAAMVASTRPDTTNTNIAFTVREFDPSVPIVATASTTAAVDVLDLAGCDEVLQLGQMLGRSMAERVLGGDARSHVVGEFDDLLIAEAGVASTSLVGTTIAQSDLRNRFRVNVVGVWQRGRFQIAEPTTELTPTSVLILAGSKEQLAAYDAAFASDQQLDCPVIIIGGGRVGRSAGRTLDAAGIDYRIIERLPERVRDDTHYVVGDAAELSVLERAGIERTDAVLVTTHDDDVNVYLTLYCRKLRPDIQIISRANLDRNVSTLHRAGSDAVLSYASIGATAIWNTLGLNDTLVLAEGLDVFRVPVPGALRGRTLAESSIRTATGCNVVAVARGDQMTSNPDPFVPLAADADLLLIGDAEAEQRFLEKYRTHQRLAVPHAVHDGARPRSTDGAMAAGDGRAAPD